jgi:hypothetical protein
LAGEVVTCGPAGDGVGLALALGLPVEPLPAGPLPPAAPALAAPVPPAGPVEATELADSLWGLVHAAASNAIAPTAATAATRRTRAVPRLPARSPGARSAPDTHVARTSPPSPVV